MDTLKWMEGYISISLTSADVAGTLRRLNGAGITAYQVHQTDDLTLQFSIRRQDLPAVRKILKKSGATLRLNNREGLFWLLKGMIRRPIMICGILVLLLLTALLPRRIYFIQVEGNDIIATSKIIEAAESCGIKFGAVRSAVRSERMKNELLAAVPELQWAGINTSGCLAIISVRERAQTQQPAQLPDVSSMIAALDGVITQLTAKSGTPLCKVGQAVTAGQVLISGYTDCGIYIRATRSEGEIYALTKRNLEVLIPSETAVVSTETPSAKKISLIFGKKRINFSKGSGISDASCGKMYREYSLILPGGFSLPVRVAIEQCTSYNTQLEDLDPVCAQTMISQFSENYLKTQMIAGSVESKQEDLQSQEGYYLSRGSYVCHEMIGITHIEEKIDEIDRKDRECGTG